MQTLYLFIDESGNLDLSPSGTRFFTLTVLSTTTPFEIAAKLLKLRYDLLPKYAGESSMEDAGYFHASEDKQIVRDQVFANLITVGEKMRIDAVIAQKNKANPVFHSQPVAFYETLGRAVLKYAISRATWEKYDHITLVFSSLFDRKKRGILKQTFKMLLKQNTDCTFSLYFHDSKCDLCNQAVDYLGWAIYRKWESQDYRSYDIIKSLIKSEFPIFEKGTTEFYSYKKNDLPNYPRN